MLYKLIMRGPLNRGPLKIPMSLWAAATGCRGWAKPRALQIAVHYARGEGVVLSGHFCCRRERHTMRGASVQDSTRQEK